MKPIIISRLNVPEGCVGVSEGMGSAVYAIVVLTAVGVVVVSTAGAADIVTTGATEVVTIGAGVPEVSEFPIIWSGTGSSSFLISRFSITYSGVALPVGSIITPLA